MKSFFLYLFFFLIIFSPVLSLDYDDFPEEDTINEYTPDDELLNFYVDNQLLINYASKKELSLFPLFTKEDVEKILIYRKLSFIKSADDLINLGFSADFAERIIPYISFKEKTVTQFTSYTRSTYRQTNELCKSSLSLLQKNYLRYNDFELFLLSEKDPGENNLLDFYNWTLCYSSDSFLKKVILGKFKASFGQGIVFSANLPGSSINMNSFLRKDVIKASTSSFEARDMEGLATEACYKNITQRFFLAQCKWDAYLENKKITSFIETGIHSDDSHKDNTKENILCSNTTFSNDVALIGVTLTGYAFNRYFSDPETKREYFISDLYANYSLENTTFFTEAAYTDSKLALSGGVIYLGERIKQLLLLRHYDKFFPTFHGAPYAISGDFDNENGFTFRNEYNWKLFDIVTCFDMWQHPETRYYEKMSTVGNEEYISVKANLKQRDISLGWKRKKYEHYVVVAEEGKVRETTKQNYKLEWVEKLSKSVKIKNRYEHSFEYLGKNSNYLSGNVIFSQLEYSHKRIDIITRFTVYSSEVTLYQYENTVLNKSDYAILTGDGSKCFLLVKFRPNDNFDIQFKASGFLESNTNTEYTALLRIIL